MFFYDECVLLAFVCVCVCVYLMRVCVCMYDECVSVGCMYVMVGFFLEYME